MLLIENQQHLDTVVTHAKAIGMYDRNDINGALENRLEYLDKYGGDRMRVTLFKDSAPFSFGFVIEQKAGDGWQHVFTGGLIFHGTPYDDGSDGKPPSAANLRIHGWSIHT